MPSGPKGHPGAAGVPGATGWYGVTGSTGAIGIPGVTGDTGVSGSQSGLPGPRGPTGWTGPKGARGERQLYWYKLLLVTCFNRNFNFLIYCFCDIPARRKTYIGCVLANEYARLQAQQVQSAIQVRQGCKALMDSSAPVCLFKMLIAIA